MAATNNLPRQLPKSMQRRRLIQSASAVASLALAPVSAADNAAAAPALADPFAAPSFTDAIAALGGKPSPSAAITLDVPAVADDGALVPVVVSSVVAGTREILVLVDPSPQPLAARFTLPEGTEPEVATRIRIVAGNATVVAVVRDHEGRLHATARSVQVNVGGCG